MRIHVKKIISLALVCAMLLTFAVALAEATVSEYLTVTPDEVKELLDVGETFPIVDVRTPEEYAEGHIPGAINIPNENIGDTRPEELPELDTPIVIYCRSGRRSEEAANKLLAMGYTFVFDLGGIQDWPYETVSGSEPGTWTAVAMPLTVEDHALSDGVLGHFHTTDLNGTEVD